MKLNLHEHEDTVREIVDKSVKEMGMEKMLGELDATWAQMEFEHDEHTRTGKTYYNGQNESLSFTRTVCKRSMCHHVIQTNFKVTHKLVMPRFEQIV